MPQGLSSALKNSKAVYQAPKLGVRTHNTVEDKTQRPTSDVGGVYSYEAIKAGTILRTEVRMRRALLDLIKNKNWHEQLSGEIRLGRSNKDDYGSVKVESKEEADLPTQKKIDSDLYVWLLSDTLLRGPALDFDPSLARLQELLQRELDVTLQEIKAFARVRRIESWQVRWGLPRPTLVGLQAGTCVHFKLASGQFDPARLANIEARGIGERTVEGYGQVCFNDPLLLKDEFFAIESKTATDVEAAKIGTTDPSHAMARAIELAAWREMIRRAALGFAGNPKWREQYLHWPARKPSMSQLGCLRETVQQVLKREDRQVLEGWIKAVRGNRKRDQRWPAGALKSLEELATQDELIWKWLFAIEQGGADEKSGRP